MWTLTVYNSNDGELVTDAGTFYIESFYHVEDILIHSGSGEILFIQSIRRDAGGRIAEVRAE